MKLKVVVISTIFLAVVSGLFYVLFNQYLTTVGHELVQSWLRSEENLIREGNLLSSATKTQKILLTSEFMKGIAVYDLSHNEPRNLIEFGEKPIVTKVISGQLLEEHHDTLLRALANSIDNSIEACVDKGEIEVLVSEDDANIKIEICDSGLGIPANILANVGQERFTYGKEHGTGLGVFNTKKFIESLGGSFAISSDEGKSTVVVMTWPKQKQNKLLLAEDTKLLVLDDDPLCHAAWRNFFKLKDVANSVEYFFTADKLKTRLQELEKNDVFIFSDFDLKNIDDGLQVLSANDLTSQSALVTAHFDEPTVKTRARKLGVPVFDKTHLAALPLEFV